VVLEKRPQPFQNVVRDKVGTIFPREAEDLADTTKRANHSFEQWCLFRQSDLESTLCVVLSLDQAPFTLEAHRVVQCPRVRSGAPLTDQSQTETLDGHFGTDFKVKQKSAPRDFLSQELNLTLLPGKTVERKQGSLMGEEFLPQKREDDIFVSQLVSCD
jgi:hypothetical protein